MTCRGIYLENVDDIPEIELLLYYLGYNYTIPTYTLRSSIPCYLFLYSIGNKKGHKQENKNRDVTIATTETRLIESIRTYEKIKYISIEDLRSLSKADV